MQRYLIASIAVCMLAPASAPANDLFDLIPENAYGFVVIVNASDTDAKLHALGQRTNIPVPSFMSMIDAKTKGASGIDSDGSVALVVLPTDVGPSAVLYIPVDDYDAMVKQLESPTTQDGVTTGQLWGQNVVIGNKQSHAIVTQASGRELLLKLLADQHPGGQTDAKDRPKEKYDITASITSSGISVVTQLIRQGINQATQVIKQQVGEESPALAGIQMYEQMLTSIDSEVSAASLSVRLDDQGALSFTNRIHVNASGKFAPALREIQPKQRDILAGFPDVPFVVVGGGVIPKDAMQSMMDLSGSMMKSMNQMYDMEPDQVDAMMKLAMKYFGDMRGMSFLLGVGEADAPLYSEMLATIDVPDAQKYLDDYRKYWEELSELVAASESSFMKGAELEELKLDGQAMLKMTMPFPKMNQVEGVNQADIDTFIRKMYGSSEMTAYIVAADEHTVLIGYSDTQLLQKALAAGSQKLSNNRGVASTSRLLPKDALMLGFWDPSATIRFANRMIKMMGGADSGFEIPAFPETSPIGWAMRAEPLAVTFHTVVPPETLDAVGSFVKSLKDSRDPSDK